MTKNARDFAISLAEVQGHEKLLIACLKYMSLADVEDMLKVNEYLEPYLGGWLQDKYNINKHS